MHTARTSIVQFSIHVNDGARGSFPQPRPRTRSFPSSLDLLLARCGPLPIPRIWSSTECTRLVWIPSTPRAHVISHAERLRLPLSLRARTEGSHLHINFVFCTVVSCHTYPGSYSAVPDSIPNTLRISVNGRHLDLPTIATRKTGAVAHIHTIGRPC